MIEIPTTLIPKLTRFEQITLEFCQGLLPATLAQKIAIRFLDSKACTQEEQLAAMAIADSYIKIVYEEATTNNDRMQD